MKKTRLFSLLLAGVLLTRSVAVPVFATESETTQPSESTQQTTVPEETTSPEETTVPEIVIPEVITGDASVLYGSKTLDAVVPLTDPGAYHADTTAALAYDLNSDTLLFAQNADGRVYPASLTKVMTALVVLERVDNLQEMVTVRQEVLNKLEPGSSNAALLDGEMMSIEDLLYCLMIPSAGDAALVLANHVAGDVETFVQWMNEKAKELGCQGTHFVNPHGWHEEQHYSTARDLAKITKAALEKDVFREIFSAATYTVPATNMSEARELETTNYLMRNSGYLNVYDPRITGGKTGYTADAGRCLVATAESGSMKLLTVVLGAKAKYGANQYTYLRYGNFEETSELLNFAFGNYSTMQVLAANQIIGQFPVENGENDAFGTTFRSVSAMVPVGSGYEGIRYEYTLSEQSLSAPIEKNQEIGVARAWLGNRCIAQETLYAAAGVAVKKTPARTPGAVDGDTLPTVVKVILIVAAVFAGIVVIALIRRQVNLIKHRRAMARKKQRAAARRKAAQSGTRPPERTGTAARRRR